MKIFTFISVLLLLMLFDEHLLVLPATACDNDSVTWEVFDSEIDLRDLSVFCSYWLDSQDLGQPPISQDINCDGIVNFQDFAVFVKSRWLLAIESDCLQFGRNSIAFDTDFNCYGINKPRMEYVPVCSRPDIFIDSSGVVDYAYATDGNIVICGRNTTLYTTMDGNSYTMVVDVSSDPVFVPYFVSGDVIKCCRVLNDGSWLLSVGRGLANRQGDLFRSSDKGLSWTHVLTMESGYLPEWAPLAMKNNEVIVGEYGYSYQMNNPRRIYYSNDYGQTWAMIIDIGPHGWNGGTGPADGQHCHVVSFGINDTNTIYASFGDLGYYYIKKFIYCEGDGGKKCSNNWSESEQNSKPFLGEANPVVLFNDDVHIYVGRDGDYYPVIWRMDPQGKMEDVLSWPSHWNDTENAPFYTDSGATNIFTIIKHDGVYYASALGYYSQKTGGIYVSPNGKNWVSAYRTESNFGVYTIVGYANGYMWGTYAPAPGIMRLFRFTPVKVKLISSIKVEAGVINGFDNEDNSSFNTNLGGWTKDNPLDNCLNPVLSDSVNEPALYGGHSMKIIGHEYSPDRYARIRSPYFTPKPKTGDYICASFWIYGANTWPHDMLCVAGIVVFGSGGQVVTANPSCFYVRRGVWQRVYAYGKVTDDNFTLGPVLRITFLTDYMQRENIDFSDMTCFIDCPQVYYTSTVHNSSDWQIGGQPRANEVASFSLRNLSDTFSLSFNWYPDSASREWHSNIPIASIIAVDGSYIHIYWNYVLQEFCITDGINNICLNSGGKCSWLFKDVIKFILTTDSSNSRLAVESSLMPLTISPETVNLGLTAEPAILILSSTPDATEFGGGLFNNISVWHKEIIESNDIKKFFANP